MKKIELEISNPCNEHCIHCYRHFLNAKKDFMTVETVATVLRQVKKTWCI